ncbi:hypothetical protein AB0G81_26905, partial [Streptomyces asoensis]
MAPVCSAAEAAPTFLAVLFLPSLVLVTPAPPPVFPASSASGPPAPRPAPPPTASSPAAAIDAFKHLETDGFPAGNLLDV